MATNSIWSKACIKSASVVLALVVAALGFALGAQAQGTQGRPQTSAAAQTTTKPTPQAGCFVIPASAKTNNKNEAHTDYVLASLDCKTAMVLSAPTAFRVLGPTIASPDGISPAITTFEEAETPQSLGCIYMNSPHSTGCVPTYAAGSGGPSAAGYGAIVLVDAYDNPDASTDLATFDSMWGLAAPPSFTKVYANGNGDCTTPAPNANWAVEESLDIEWAHVFASKAAIVLVEACSSSNTDLYYAEQVAFNYIVTNFKTTGGQVSNSWGEDEFSGEISDDPLFADYHYLGGPSWLPHILGFASAGDCGYLDNVNNGGCYSPGNNNYPSVNPWLVSAGGTSILRNSANGDFYSEACWSGSGGGPSKYETFSTTFTGGHVGPWADYQYPIYGQGVRHVPDLSFDADPASGVYFYSLYGIGGWGVVGGTSVSAPSLAGIVNRAGNRLGSVLLTPVTGNDDSFANWQNTLMYSQLSTNTLYGINFYDVKTGSNGSPKGAVALYDECTGVGSPRGTGGK